MGVGVGGRPRQDRGLGRGAGEGLNEDSRRVYQLRKRRRVYGLSGPLVRDSTVTRGLEMHLWPENGQASGRGGGCVQSRPSELRRDCL